MSRTRFLTVLVCLAAAAGLATSACGVNVDTEPRALDLPSTTTTAPAAPPAGRFATVLYYVADGELLPVVQDLPDRSLTTVLNALLEAPEGRSAEQGLGTSIPAGTELLGIQRDRNQVAINLSESFDNVVGLSRQQAIGQLVLTITELDDIQIVQFRVEGENITVSSPVRGDSNSVAACDFLPLMATVEDAVGKLERLPVVALSDLDERLTELNEVCIDPGPSGTGG